ncbi:CAP domain-containing protein [Paenibacillus aceti]
MKLKVAKMGLIFSVLAASLAVVPAGYETVSAAAAGKSMAAVFAQVQAERAAQVVALVNKERAAAGLEPLIVHTNLTKMAKDKAVDMYRNHYFEHTSPTYGSPFDMMDAYNITYLYAGENIAKGQRSAEEAVEDWMDSPGHRANILNPKYKLIGVGYYNGYWVQEFIGK